MEGCFLDVCRSCCRPKSRNLFCTCGDPLPCARSSTSSFKTFPTKVVPTEDCKSDQDGTVAVLLLLVVAEEDMNNKDDSVVVGEGREGSDTSRCCDDEDEKDRPLEKQEANTATLKATKYCRFMLHYQTPS